MGLSHIRARNDLLQRPHSGCCSALGEGASDAVKTCFQSGNVAFLVIKHIQCINQRRQWWFVKGLHVCEYWSLALKSHRAQPQRLLECVPRRAKAERRAGRLGREE